MTRLTHLTFVGLLLIALGLFSSCDKNEDTPEPELSEEEVTEFLEASLSRTNGGMTEELESTTEEMSSLNLQEFCDSVFENTLNYEYIGAQVQASSTIGYTFDLTCNGLNLPQSAVMAIGSAVTFNTTRINSEGNSEFAGNLTGLELSSPDIVWNGDYSRNGAVDFRFRQANNGISDLDLSLTNVVVEKESQMIKSGTGAFRLVITLNENSQTYEGTITFNGDQTATVVINGIEFVIDLR